MFGINKKREELFLQAFIGVLKLVFLVTTVQGVSESPYPHFEVEPKDTVVVEGGSAILDCSARGSSSPIIRWKGKDGHILNLISDPHRSQLSNGSLYISNVLPGSRVEDDYQCVATWEDVGSIVSRVASVKLASLSEFDIMPRDLKVLPGQTAHFSCVITGVPSANITWLKDGRPVVFDESRMLVLPSGSLEIDEVKLSDEGVYQCNASTSDQYRLSDKAQLVVDNIRDLAQRISQPLFIATPQSIVVTEGNAVTLDCAAIGSPRPWITWLKDGATIDMADLDSRFLKIGTGSLQISKVQEKDQGAYQCRAENREDSVDSTATVEVQVTPRFIKRPQSIFAFEKEDIELECEIYGKPEPYVYWMKDGDIINQNEYLQLVNGYNLKILGLMETDSGIFQCVGTNPAGNVQASAQLIILKSAGESVPAKDVPTAPRNVKAVIVSTRFVTLSWTEPYQTNGAIVMYSVFYRQEGVDRERMVNTSRSRLEEVNIQGLQPARTYYFRVVAYNHHGSGASSAELRVETQPEVHVPGPPQRLQATPTSPTSIMVEWDPPEHKNGPIQYYKMFYMEGDSAEEHHITSPEASYHLTNLAKFTEYSIWVVAFNQNGAGASTEEVLARTFSDAPSDTPQNVTLEAASSTSIIVRWESPPKEHQNGIITGYKIRYKLKGRRRGVTVTTDGNRRLYALTGLERRSEYQVRLWAMNVNGSGPPTEWLPIETYENDLDESQVPDKPSSMKARSMMDSITVTWIPPKNQNIMVRGYTIGWGKGIPDVYTKLLDGKQRFYIIENLEPNSEYIISLRAYNEIGDGQPIYEAVRTRDETTPEPFTPLIPPMGLKAIVLSSSTVVLYWTDTSLSGNQFITDNRRYVVRYTYHYSSGPRYKYYNATDLNCMIDDLRPNTQYEFTVKVVKGKRESPWSMIVTNTTEEAAPSSAPRDLTTVPVEGQPTAVMLNWQPPKQANGQITGYVISYTTNNSQRDRDWVLEEVVGDKMTVTVSGLTPSTTYYFKIRARNKKGYGPLSSTLVYTTESGNRVIPISSQSEKDTRGLNSTILYIILGCSIFAVIILITTIVICCRRRALNQERSKKGYIKGNMKGKLGKSGIKPPDLWIHHDQMELKAQEKTQSSEGAAAVTPVPHSSQDFEVEKFQMGSNSLDKRTYVPTYIGKGGTQIEEKSSIGRKAVKPKPIMLPVDTQPPREPIATATPIPNGSLNQLGDSKDAASQPIYPRTQYTISRAHITVDTSAQSPENPYASQAGYDSVGSVSGGTPGPPHPLVGVASVVTSHQPSCSGVAVPSSEAGGSGTMGKRPQGHPLRSFSVPAPPPQSAPTTPQPKHVVSSVTVRPQGSASPYKKAGILAAPSSLKSQEGARVVGAEVGPTVSSSSGSTSWQTPEKTDESKIQPSYSTEELNQEMANLEGLMKDLNAITASEFEC